jgi:hypothetical protein
MPQHRSGWLLAAGVATLAVLAACNRDRGSGVTGPPPAARADVSGTLSRRTRLLATDGTVLHESSETREVSAELTRGVARSDSGPLLALIVGASLQATAASHTDSAGRVYDVRTTGGSLPTAVSVRVDGRLFADVRLDWARFGEVNVLTDRSMTVYSDGHATAAESWSFAPSRVVQPSESARAAQLHDWREGAGAPAMLAGCDWGMLVVTGMEVTAAAVAYNIFGQSALPVYMSALARYLDSLLNWVYCLFMI